MQPDQEDFRKGVPLLTRPGRVLFPIQAESLVFTVLLGMLAALPALSIDINAPALLTVERQFGGPTGVVALTMSLFMFGFAFGQFAAGSLSDRYGRRPVLMVGLGCYAGAAIGCALATSMHALIGWRLLQGVGAGASAVLAFTIVHDLFKGDTARSKRSYVTVVFGLAPMLAPSFGALVLERAGWRPIYYILALGGFWLLGVVWFGVGESRAGLHAGLGLASQSGSIRRAYERLLRDRRFVGLAAVNALSFGGMFAYIAGSPFVLMGQLQLSSSAYSAVFASTAAALTAGAWFSGRLATAGVCLNRLLWLGLSFAAGTAVLLTAVLMTPWATLPFVVPILVVNLFCRGLVAPNAQHLALEPICEESGTATAAIGVLQIVLGAVSSAVVAAVLPVVGPVGMAAVMATLAVGSLALWIPIAGATGRRKSAPCVAVVEHGV